MEEMKQIEELAKPLVNYLRDNYHPHTSIVIKQDKVAVVEDVLSIPITK